MSIEEEITLFQRATKVWRDAVEYAYWTGKVTRHVYRRAKQAERFAKKLTPDNFRVHSKLLTQMVDKSLPEGFELEVLL